MYCGSRISSLLAATIDRNLFVALAPGGVFLPLFLFFVVELLGRLKDEDCFPPLGTLGCFG